MDRRGIRHLDALAGRRYLEVWPPRLDRGRFYLRLNANAKLYLCDSAVCNLEPIVLALYAQRLASVALQTGLSGFAPNRIAAFRPSGFDP